MIAKGPLPYDKLLDLAIEFADALAAACQERDVRMVLLNVDGAWDPLRSDPRFAGVLGCAPRQP